MYILGELSSSSRLSWFNFCSAFNPRLIFSSLPFPQSHLLLFHASLLICSLLSFSSCFQFFLFILHSLLLYISPASHLLLFSNLSPSSPLSYCPHLPSPLLSGLEINPQSDNLQLNRQLIPLKAMLRRGGECLHGLQQMRCTSGKLISRPNSQMLQILSIFPPLSISSYFSPPRSLAWFPSEEFFTN